jgi:hypothetical protein
MLFTERLPRKPYCANDFADGIKIRPAATAIKYRHIQLNPPGILAFMLFDLDMAESAWAFERHDLPEPTFIVINRANGHCHYIYALLAPVVFGHGHDKPRQYFLDIEYTYRLLLGADHSYSGLLCKNPWHPYWLTVATPLAIYDLNTLADYVTIQKRPKKKEQQAGQGRNVSLFDDLRHWAYRNRRHYCDYGQWLNACMATCAEMNVFDHPLPYPEIKSIAKSVARWTWKNITPQAFSNIQRTRAKKKGLANEDKRASAKLMRARGKTVREIAQELNMPKSTISDWLKSSV